MKTLRDLKPGEERYKHFYSKNEHLYRVRYDYRAADCELFTTVQASLPICREKRDEWLKNGRW